MDNLQQNRIIIFGSDGMLGNYVTKYFTKYNFDVVALTRTDLDIKNISFETLYTFLNKYITPKPVTIINAIGMILPSNTQKDVDNLAINSAFPYMLSIYCKYIGWKLIHPSTDCVYSGRTGNYTEADIPDETNIYGRTKYYGEPSYGTVIRVSIIGEEIRHKYSLIEWVKKNAGKTINGFINHKWNGITCFEYCKIMYKIITEDLYWNGVKHIASPTVISKYELLGLINNAFNLGITIIPVEHKDTIIKTLKHSDCLQFVVAELRDQLYELSQNSWILD